MNRTKPSSGVLLGLLSAAASAGTTNWGSHDDPIEVAVATVQSGGVPTAFTDVYTFVVPAGATLLGSTVVASNSLPVTNLTAGSYSLVDFGADGIPGTGDDAVLGLWSYGTTAVFQPASAGPGNYMYVVGGLAIGTFGGTYTITSTIQSSPVPEPSITASLLAGLALLAGLRRRPA